jgi:ribonuclease HII
MVRFPHKTLERSLVRQGLDGVVGIDEVGMGCLAGPVVVCAVHIASPFYARRWREFERLRDSKLLSAAQRERFAAALSVHPDIRHILVAVPPREVDTYNVLGAARRGMRKAVTRLLSADAHTLVLVDGNRAIPDLAYPQQTIVGGDRLVFAIAAASVLAKVHRDALMRRYAVTYPGYGFEVHKGYGTAQHVSRLRELGPCPLHRRSFSLT